MHGLSSKTDRGTDLVLACVIDDLGTGGAQRLVSLMARNFARHDIRLVVIGLGMRDDERASLIGHGVEVHLLPASRLSSPGRLLGLVRLLRTIGPDLVHTHLLAAHILGGIAGRLLRIPVVSTLHNVDPHPRFAGTWKRTAESLCLRFLASRLIAVGPCVGASNAHRLGKRSIEVLPNPLSTRLTDEERRGGQALQRLRSDCRARVTALVGSSASTCHFVTVGRLASEKGWPGFLDVFEQLRRTHPDIRLIAVGDGPCHESLGQEITKRDLDEHVHLLGRREDVRTFYLGSDFFVLNSRIEGLPMALLEAMAAGLPVVGTRVGDVEYVAGEGVASLVRPGRTEEMVGALRDALEQRADRAARAQERRRRVLARFSLERWTEELIALYRESVARPGGERQAAATSTAPARRARSTPSGQRTRATDADSGHESEASALTGDSPEPLHIVEFIDGLNAGGAQALLALRARNARRMGYRIDLVSLGMSTTVPEQLSEHIDGIHLFPSRHVFEAGRIVRICALLRKLRPDVIHTHLRTSNTVGALCGRLTGIPVVCTLHNVFPELGLVHARRDWAEKWALRLGADRIVAVGPAVARAHRPRLGGKRVTPIPNPVELPAERLDRRARKAQARASLDLPFDAANARIVLVVARLTRAKGALDAVRVLQRLERASSGSPVPKLLIAGQGELQEELQGFIETNGLGESVFLLGRSERVRELMAASDALLLNSYIEGLPLVLLEAMSMHLPIIATRVGDVSWLLNEGELGELVDPGDLAGTAAAVERTLALPDEAIRSRTERAFRRVRDEFSVNRWLLDIDRELCASSGVSEPVAKERKAADSPDPVLEDVDFLRDPVTRLK